MNVKSEGKNRVNMQCTIISMQKCAENGLQIGKVTKIESYFDITHEMQIRWYMISQSEWINEWIKLNA